MCPLWRGHGLSRWLETDWLFGLGTIFKLFGKAIYPEPSIVTMEQNKVSPSYVHRAMILSTFNTWCIQWRLSIEISLTNIEKRARIRDYIHMKTLGCNYSTMPEFPGGVLGQVSDRDAPRRPSTQNATRVKKGGRNYTFCPILMKNRGRNTTFSSFLLKIGVKIRHFPHFC